MSVFLYFFVGFGLLATILEIEDDPDSIDIEVRAFTVEHK